MSDCTALATRSPEAERVRAFLADARTRVTVLAVARGVATGIGSAAVLVSVLLLVLPWRPGNMLAWIVGSIGVASGVVWALGRTRATRLRPARVIERRAAQCQNVLVTAEELLNASPTQSTTNASAHPTAVVTQSPRYVQGLVFREAARLTTQLELSELLPAGRTMLAVAASVLLFALGSSRRTSPATLVARAFRVAMPAATARIDEVTATITAPAYTALAPETLRNPARIDAMQGSRIAFRIRSNADSLLIQTAHGSQRVGPSSRDEFLITLPADIDGFIGIEPWATGRAVDVRRLIGLTVAADAPPTVRITAPGHDVRLPNTHASLNVVVDATDDVGLGTLVLRYTKVSGSGERFTFADGDVPLVVTHTSPRHWSARVTWPLDSLVLGAGDMIVYRAIAADRRPGTTPQESDSFIAEIVAPGSEAIAGFSIDPDQERYAVSQQMVVLKTERLIARRSQMLPDSTMNASQELAAEQRRVRVEFVFMMGGELADAPDPDASMTDLNEEAEAEGEADIAAGRMANQGRMALMKAIRSMSRAAALLTTAELTSALVAEKAAVAQLEQAFSRQRIILRALSEREQLDPTRRLSGTLADAHSNRRAIPTVTPATLLLALRRSLADLISISSAQRPHADLAAQCTALAERVLRLDPSRMAVQQAAARVSEAAVSFVGGHDVSARAQLDRAATLLSNLLGEQLPPSFADDASTVANTALNARRLDGAVRDALRGGLRGAKPSPSP